MIELLNQQGGEAGECAPFGKGSYDIALLSTGGVFQAVRAVAAGEVRNACKR
jgi:acetoin utilization deacetylase AcuC-like enzyme